jgi:hypothetical protein
VGGRQQSRSFIDPQGHVDYRLVSDSTTLATCELKGPVRPTFFKRESGNYVGEVKEDWDKQLRRQQRLPAAEHFVGVLAYGTQAEVAKQFEAAPIRQQLPSELDMTFQETASPTGRPVTLILLKIPTAEVKR